MLNAFSILDICGGPDCVSWLVSKVIALNLFDDIDDKDSNYDESWWL